MKKRIIALCALIAALTCMVAFTAHASGLMDLFGQKGKTVTITQEEYDRLKRYETMDTILQYIEQWYYQEPDVDALIENATRGLMYGLEDPYSFYYNDTEWADMWDDDEGEYYEGDEYVFEKDSEIFYDYLDDGDYLYSFVINDIYGDFDVTDPVWFTIDGDDIYFEEA